MLTADSARGQDSAPAAGGAGGVCMRMDGRVLCKHLIRKRNRKSMVSSISGTLLCLTKYNCSKDTALNSITKKPPQALGPEEVAWS